MPKRRYRTSQPKEPALKVNVGADLYDGGAYLLVADRNYNNYPSRIVYIGMTLGGARRVAESAAKHITGALERNILELEAWVYEVNKAPREQKSLPRLLEGALLARHRQRFGDLPLLNKRGGAIEDSGSYFTDRALDNILDRHSGLPKDYHVESEPE